MGTTVYNYQTDVYVYL